MPDTQALLDTVLSRADTDAAQRFEQLCGSEIIKRVAAPAITMRRPRTEDLESWTDDLERASIALSRQDFGHAGALVARWLAPSRVDQLDEHGAYLYARSLVLQGAIRRDQGRLDGPGSARVLLSTAREWFTQLDIGRRVAQVDLGLVVLGEMSGDLERSARDYELLSTDPRLDERDRALALSWVGTALSKVGGAAAIEQALTAMTAASATFERLDEPTDWSVAQQKLALIHRARGDLNRALVFVDRAEQSRISDSPLQFVRLSTARAHVLLTDSATFDEGLRVLESARTTAAAYGLRHQLDSIRRVHMSMTMD